MIVGPLLLFGGYMLVYAAVARGGVFATEPWNGLYTDAYGYAAGQAGQKAGVQVASAMTTVATDASQSLKNFSRPRSTGFVGQGAR